MGKSLKEKYHFENILNSNRIISIREGAKIRARKSTLYIISFGMLVFGIQGYFFSSINQTYNYIAGGLAILGLVLILLSFCKIIATQFLEFNRIGLVIGDKKGSFLIPWEEFTEINVGEWNYQICLFFNVSSTEKIIEKAKLISIDYANRIKKQMNSNLTWAGYHFCIMSSSFEEDSALLFRVIIDKNIDNFQQSQIP